MSTVVNEHYVDPVVGTLCTVLLPRKAQAIAFREDANTEGNVILTEYHDPANEATPVSRKFRFVPVLGEFPETPLSVIYLCKGTIYDVNSLQSVQHYLFEVLI